MPLHAMLKKKYMQRKKNQNAFKYDCKLVSRRCESYRMYLENDSPHQAVMIVCGVSDFL